MAQNNSSPANDTAAAFESGRASTRGRLSENPVSALAGGFALGALLGAVIPATNRERRALQPLGEKASDAARAAARQAAEAGRDKLNQVTGEVVTSVGAKVVDAVAPAKD